MKLFKLQYEKNTDLQVDDREVRAGRPGECRVCGAVDGAGSGLGRRRNRSQQRLRLVHAKRRAGQRKLLVCLPVIGDLSKSLILSWVGMLGETGKTQLCKRF